MAKLKQDIIYKGVTHYMGQDDPRPTQKPTEAKTINKSKGADNGTSTS